MKTLFSGYRGIANGSRRRGAHVNRTFYLFFGLILLGVLAALWWAANTHKETVRTLPESLASDFAPLLEANRITDLHLGEIQRRVQALRERHPYLLEIVIRKQDLDGVERTVHPIFYDLDHPVFRLETDPAYSKQGVMSQDGALLCTLYIKIDAQRGRLFNAAISGSIAALLLIAFVGAYTLRSKEEEVRKTNVLLEEKQRELIRLERLALAGQIAANLLHDLKKPVLNIRAEAENIKQPDIRKTIKEETELFLNLLREVQLESFLRQDRETAEFNDVGEALLRSLRLVRYAQGGVKVHFNLPNELPFIFGQRHQLVQIFSNILLNGFQALEGEGNIHITASEIDQDDAAWLEVLFTDDGPGIPYEALARIFEPFYSTRPAIESTGLGDRKSVV